MAHYMSTVGSSVLPVIPMARPRGSTPNCGRPTLPPSRWKAPAQRLRSRPQTDVRSREVPDALQPGTGIPMVRAEPFPPGCAPPFSPFSRRPKSRPCRWQSSLPYSRTQSLRTDRAFEPRGTSGFLPSPTPPADSRRPETADPGSGPDPAAGDCCTEPHYFGSRALFFLELLGRPNAWKSE